MEKDAKGKGGGGVEWGKKGEAGRKRGERGGLGGGRGGQPNRSRGKPRCPSNAGSPSVSVCVRMCLRDRITGTKARNPPVAFCFQGHSGHSRLWFRHKLPPERDALPRTETKRKEIDTEPDREKNRKGLRKETVKQTQRIPEWVSGRWRRKSGNTKQSKSKVSQKMNGVAAAMARP